MNKTKVSFSISPELLTETKCLLAQAECSSNSEFFMKAVQFYIGYLHTQNNKEYLGSVISGTVEGILGTQIDRLLKMMFKQAVQTAKQNILFAQELNYTYEDLDMCQAQAEEYVKKTNGNLRCEF